jgi:formylglycine-generating enzyme required for sulfatase activity
MSKPWIPLLPLFLASVGCGETPKAPTTTGAAAPASAPAATPKAALPRVIPARDQAAEPAVAYDTVLLPAGTYSVGSPAEEADRDDDEALHEVVLARPVLVGRTEVTQALWDSVMTVNPSKKLNPEYPVEQVSWTDALHLANALSARDGLEAAYVIDGASVTFRHEASGWRLPTEAEWEIAARGGGAAAGPYSGGTDVDGVAWHETNADGGAHKPCTRAPNALGLCDMSGNVAEWVWDRYAPYPTGKVEDPRGPDAGDNARVNRGGAWSYAASYARVANRNRGLPDVRFVILGVRLVRNG